MDCKKYIGCCRLLRGISQAVLAGRLGISATNWQNKLTRNDFRISEMENIAQALDAELVVQFIDKKTKKPLL